MTPERHFYVRNKDHPTTRTRAWQLVQDFHALAHPSLHAAAEGPQSALREDAVLVRPSTTALGRLAIVQQTFMPLVEALFDIAEPHDSYSLRGRLVSYCQTQLYPEDEQFLVDANGQPMTADQILLGRPRLWDMYVTWRNAEEGSVRCPSLQLYMNQALADYHASLVSGQPRAS